MKLLLTSSGNTNKSIESALGSLLEQPFSKSSLVFIPTAANVEENTSEWLALDINNFKKLGFKDFKIIDISKAEKNVWLESLERADIIIFGGGNVKYLLDCIRKIGLEEILHILLKTKVYVGISAGSMITAKNISLTTSGILYYEDTGNFEEMKGLGFVDFEIRPHLNNKDFPKVTLDTLAKLAKKNPTPFYAIDDNTAVIVAGNNVSVVTEGTWKKFS